MDFRIMMEWDDQRSAYSRCQWCHGKGCMGCESEAKSEFARRQKEYDERFPDGPEVVTIPRDRLSDAKDSIGAEAIQKSFGVGGGGAAEVFDNLEKAGFGRPKPLTGTSDS